MKLISFAQNLEDVVLWRALGHLNSGFYVDIGAGWPEHHSVTKIFYDAGWHGINVEPSPDLFCELNEGRERDINLQALVGLQNQNEVPFYYIPGTGLSTISASLAQSHMQRGCAIQCRTLPMLTLKEIFLRHCPDCKDIHFLKVDTEGSEKDVLEGNDWNRWRPWVVLVETVDVISKSRRNDGIDALMDRNGYAKMLFDGVNTFYADNRLSWLKECLVVPANVLDGYVPSELVRLRELLSDADRWGRELQLQIMLQRLESPQGLPPPAVKDSPREQGSVGSDNPLPTVVSATGGVANGRPRTGRNVVLTLGKRIIRSRLLRRIAQIGLNVLRRYPALGRRLIAIVYRLLRGLGFNDREIGGLLKKLRNRLIGVSGNPEDSGRTATGSTWSQQPWIPNFEWSTQVVKYPWVHALMRQGGR